MATKRLESDDDMVVEGEFDDISVLQGDIDAQLDAVIGEFGGEKELNAKIKVYKIQKGEGKMGWVFDCLADELPILERVRDEYGPGDYMSRFYVGGKLKNSFPFSIATPRVNPQAAISAQKGSDVGVLAEVIKESMNGLKELIVQNNAPQNQPSMLEMQTHMMTQMVAMKEMFGGGGSKGSPIRDLKEMMGLVDELRGDKQSAEPKGIMDVLGGLVDKAIPALTLAAEAGQEHAQAPKPNPTKRPQADQKTKETNDMSLAMKMQLGFLCRTAAKNADPSTYAGLIIDQSTNDQLNQLVKLLESETWLGDLSKINKDVANYPEWFGELKKEIMGELFPDNIDENKNLSDTPGETETGNSPSNVRTAAEDTNNNNA